jgi:hypothetical protein
LHVFLEEAARHYGVTQQQLVSEIRFYAMRNRAFHSGIRRLIDRCQFDALAQRIVDDRAHLEKGFKDNPKFSRWWTVASSGCSMCGLTS